MKHPSIPPISATTKTIDPIKVVRGVNKRNEPISQVIEIPPISVNQAWQGKRFKTPKYKRYEASVLLMLSKVVLPEKPYHIEIVYGFSSPLSDIDNPTKLVLDILQKKYGFNDRDIVSLHLKKEIVKKGKEYFKFKIENS